jgi:hypothetical protein
MLTADAATAKGRVRIKVRRRMAKSFFAAVSQFRNVLKGHEFTRAVRTAKMIIGFSP